MWKIQVNYDRYWVSIFFDDTKEKIKNKFKWIYLKINLKDLNKFEANVAQIVKNTEFFRFDEIEEKKIKLKINFLIDKYSGNFWFPIANSKWKEIWV